jgi:hypothetical protein|tara:strand:- start:997 stop:1215 length:219 start_codon:yes stop_codon:yes gene_type:complete
MFTHVRKKDLFRLSLDSKSLQKKVMSPLFQRLAAQLKKQKCVIARPDPVFLQDYADRLNKRLHKLATREALL